MNTQLQKLIDQIKNEGVRSGEEKAAEITKEAEARAAAIVEEAKREAAEIVSTARREADRKTVSGNEAVRQAGRDLLIALQKRIQELFDQVIRQETTEAFRRDVLEEAIVSIVKAWNPDQNQPVEVLLSEKNLTALEKGLRARLSEEMRKGVTLKASPAVKTGFRIAEKDGAAYYNFTAEGIAEALAAYLNPRLAETLREASKGL